VPASKRALLACCVVLSSSSQKLPERMWFGSHPFGEAFRIKEPSMAGIPQMDAIAGKLKIVLAASFRIRRDTRR
jgi:hypothetical protein